jgi:hypothetical protein
MTGAVVMTFRAKTWSEARETALTKWREVTENESAELPPLTHMDLTQTDEDGDFLVIARMDIDRVQIEKTGP